MVRLVFRPYTQIRPSICTSERLRASTRVSSGFALFRHSSPSFGSQRSCSARSANVALPPALNAGPPACTPIAFATHKGFPPKYSHARWTPWSVFQDGSIRGATANSSPRASMGWHRDTLQGTRPLPSPLSASKAAPCPSAGQSVDQHQPSRAPANASLLTISRAFHSLSKVLFILPSRYLCAIGLLPLFSLRWNLPPLFELHSQATRLPDWAAIRLRLRSTGLSPSPAPLSRGLARQTPPCPPSHPQLRHLVPDSNDGLIPLHSPLLRESLLVSFPPLTDMLKFSGSSRLT